MGVLLPDAFLDKMKRLLKDEFPEFLASYDHDRLYGLRVNTLKCSVEQFLDITSMKLKPIPWTPTGFYYDEAERPGKHPHYHAGLYYIQEPSAMAPVELLEVRPGERVLDLCAAPGGKSTQIAAKLAGEGLLVTNDIHTDRVKALVKNMELSGARNAVVLNEQPEKLMRPFRHYFDKVLIDAPCSGEGMFRKEEDMAKAWQPDWADRYAGMQRELLTQAAAMLRPGGRIVYSTCTFSPEENEAMIAEFLEAYPQFAVLPVATQNGFRSGQPAWVGAMARSQGGEAVGDAAWEPPYPGAEPAGAQPEGRGVPRRQQELPDNRSGHMRRPQELPDGCSGIREQREQLKFGAMRVSAADTGALSDTAAVQAVSGTVRLWPHLLAGEGHFAAVLQHNGSIDEPEQDEPAILAAAADRMLRPAIALTAQPDKMRQSARGPGHRKPMVRANASAAVDLQPMHLFLQQFAAGVSLERFTLHGDHVYASYAGLPDLNGIRVIRPGWYLGSIRNQRFEPSHALALGMRAADAARVISLSAEEPAAVSYLKGETLEIPADQVIRQPETIDLKGYCLVCIDGFPVGWGKWLGGMLKNEYPAGWRWI